MNKERKRGTLKIRCLKKTVGKGKEYENIKT